MFIVCIHLHPFFYSLPVKYSIDHWAYQSLVIVICFLYLLSLDQDMLHRLMFKTTIWIREDRLRANTWYLCKNKRSMAIITCEKYFFIGVKLAGEIFIPSNLHLLILRFFYSTILFRGVNWRHSSTPIRCLPGKRIIVFQYYLN